MSLSALIPIIPSLFPSLAGTTFILLRKEKLVLNPITMDHQSIHMASSSLSPRCLLENSSGTNDFSDAALKYITQMLLEEDSDNTSMFTDCLALQAAEKSFSDVLERDTDNPKLHSPLVKDFAAHSEEQIDQVMEMFDKLLICNGGVASDLYIEANRCQKRTKTQVVDLGMMLTRCSKHVASGDINAAIEELVQIRQHSSPYGDASKRVAHYFANGLAARISGKGTQLYAAQAAKKPSSVETLKAYKLYLTVCPFHRISNIFSTATISGLSENSTRLHIIDFGILYGFQWPCLIQRLSVRPGGPPKLRITGIELPQPGSRPAERVEETGRRLVEYCKRFKVPFEYNAIAKNWESLRLEDLKIDRDEVIVANCFYRLKNVSDEMDVREKNARERVLKLIRKINPDVFIHAIMSGSYSSPFFTTRFREALFHFSTMFDILEATVSREDEERVLYEKEVLGREVLGVIACEGLEREERPETCRQWEVRSVKAGLRKLPLKEGILERARNKVKLHYHKDFHVVDEGDGWLQQGWKGRTLYAVSCWKRA